MTVHSFISRSFLAILFISISLVSCEDDEVQKQLPPTIASYSPESQFGGSMMTITGTNFGTKVADVKVYFYDGAEAVIDELTKTSITVVVPDDAYVGHIKVKVKEKEVEGESFTVLQMCYMGNEIFLPCNKVKPKEAGRTK